MPSAGIADRRIRNRALTTIDKFSVKNRRYMYDNFQTIWQISANTGFGAPVGTINVFNSAESPAGNTAVYEVYNTTAQTAVAPTFSGAGLNVAYDQVNAHAIEIGFGGNSTRGHQSFVGPIAAPVGAATGDFPAFFTRLKFSIAVANGGNVQFGFRVVQTYAAAVTTYTDYFSLVSTAGVITGSTQLASGGAVNSTPNLQGVAIANWANTETHEFRIECKPVPGSSAYSLSGLYDGKYLQGLPAYAFGTGLTVFPFCIITQNATLTGAVNLVEYEGGFLATKI